MDTSGKKSEKAAALARFTVLCETKFGEAVCLVGSIPELHSWNSKGPIELSPENYTAERPLWITAAEIPLPLNVQVEYKFFKRLPDSKGESWETLPGDANHAIKLTASSSVEVKHTFGHTDRQIEVTREDSAVQASVPRTVQTQAAEELKEILTRQSSGYGKLRKATTIPKEADLSDSCGEGDYQESPMAVSSDDILIFVAYLLPLVITREKNGTFSFTKSRRILFPALFQLAETRKMRIKWVGLMSLETYTPEEQEQIRTSIEKFDAYPVFVDKETLEDCTCYYDSVIAPVFHNFVSYKRDTGVRNTKLYRAYCNMNKAFVETILSVYKKEPKSMILFNDPYFLLAPKLILDKEAPHIGYFFHSPFPSCEIFKIFPSAQEFMESVLCCDIVGFQLYEYARHFFTSCQRLLGLQAESRRGGLIGIIYKGRDVIIRVGHVGISRDYTESVMKSEEYKAELIRIADMGRGRKIVASVDKLSPVSGIKNKLMAYKALLEQYPKYRKELLLVQYCTPGSKWAFAEETSREIKELARDISTKYPGTIRCEEVTVSNDKRLALFTEAAVLLVTSLRDGFCLLPFEYLVAKDVNKTSPGSVILSEFAGCVTVMSSIKRINPYNISEITENILEAVETPQQSRDPKFQHNLNYIMAHDAETWLKSLIVDMKQGHNKNETALYLGAIDRKILKAGRHFKELKAADIEKEYQKAINRVILLDSEGTIIPIMPQAVIQTTDVVSGELKQILDLLCKDDRNSVYILSGKPKHLIDRWFSSVNKLGLGAEYGYHFRPNTEKEWKIAHVAQSEDWKAKTHNIFLWFKERTDGSGIEIKDNSLVWLYKDCDPELGEWQAKELDKILKTILSEYPDITTVHGKGFVEVKPKKLEKGELSQSIIEDIKKKKGKGNIDFIFAIGDDVSDEAMFKKVNSLCSGVKELKHQVSTGRMQMKDCAAFTCTVGRKPSHARYYVDDYHKTIELLNVMSVWSMKMPRNRSTDDLVECAVARPEGHMLHSPPFISKTKKKDVPELDLNEGAARTSTNQQVLPYRNTRSIVINVRTLNERMRDESDMDVQLCGQWVLQWAFQIIQTASQDQLRMEEAPQLKFKGIPFTYAEPAGGFVCDTKSMLYVMQTQFPAVYADTLKRFPELEKVLAEAKDQKEPDKAALDTEWKPVAKDRDNRTESISTEEGEKSPQAMVVQETKPAKPGMIARLSKGIRKIIAKITPTKFHKRLHLVDPGFRAILIHGFPTG